MSCICFLTHVLAFNDVQQSTWKNPDCARVDADNPDFPILFIYISFFDEIHVGKRIAPDGTPRFEASHLGLFCVPMSHKKDVRLIWV